MCHGYATGFHLFHKWSSYGAPKPIEEGDFRVGTFDNPLVAQRRECLRCGAVDYRYVTIHD